MDKATKVTFEEYQQEMISYAKEVQGENYAGDDYYMQVDCWKDRFDDGQSAKEAVYFDMGYWD